MTAQEWRKEAAREAGDAQFKIAHAREHIYALRRGIEHGKAQGYSIRIAQLLGDLNRAHATLEQIKLELPKAAP